MRYLPLVCRLFASLALANLALMSLALAQDQSAPPAADVPPEYRPPILRDDDFTLPDSAAKVAPDAPVITIKGVCDHPAPSNANSSSATCQTVITRAQFERLADALLKNMRDSRKRSLASAYPNLLAMAREAEARGVEKTSRFQERLAFARTQILSQELIRQIDEESAQVPEKDIEEYYHNHAGEFETATLERIFVPNRKRLDPPKEKATPDALNAQRKESEDAMTRVAQELHARAVAGEAFMTLQKDAYAAAGATDVPPNPSLGTVHADNLPVGQASVFDLKPGEVSSVLSDSTGHYIYKLDTKTNEPLEKAKNGIHKILQNQREQEAIEAVQRPVTSELNPAYFGPAEKPRKSGDSKSQ